MRNKCVLLVVLSLLIIPILVQATDKSLPDQCVNNCVSTYGTVLGISPPDVKAYSNCKPGCVIDDPSTHSGTYTGTKWQCVEFARRWLLRHKGAVYGDVDIAADIWTKIDSLNNVATNEKLSLTSHVNGSSQSPVIGDLLIYAKALNGTGHVAVITDIDYIEGVIEVGEQNYHNAPWSDNHARKIKFIIKDGGYWLLDGYLLGWKHINS